MLVVVVRAQCYYYNALEALDSVGTGTVDTVGARTPRAQTADMNTAHGHRGHGHRGHGHRGPHLHHAWTQDFTRDFQ